MIERGLLALICDVAIKLESVRTQPPQLGSEAKMMRLLAGGAGIPTVKWFGREGDYSVLVEELLGKSLEELFVAAGHRFSLKTTLMIADQLLGRLEYIHSRGVLHRDVKPDNFMTGLGSRANQIYVIDFGLSRRFRDGKTGAHIPFRDGRNMTGTARYASVNTHLGIEQSRRDDVEAIGYVLVYFLTGSLPWMGIKAATRPAKYEAIGERKMATSVETLCAGLPAEFGVFLAEVRKLDFEDTPDYAFYRQLFRDCLLREGFAHDYEFDWVVSGGEERRYPPLRLVMAPAPLVAGPPKARQLGTAAPAIRRPRKT